jgi:hypothetical protein
VHTLELVADYSEDMLIVSPLFGILRRTQFPRLGRIIMRIVSSDLSGRKEDMRGYDPAEFCPFKGKRLPPDEDLVLPSNLTDQLRSVLIELKDFRIATNMRRFLCLFGRANTPDILKLRVGQVHVIS